VFVVGFELIDDLDIIYWSSKAVLSPDRAWHDCASRLKDSSLPKIPGTAMTKVARKENTHDDKGKDPLERNGLGQELANPDGGCQDAQCEAHGVVLRESKHVTD